ncbi:MAG: Hpt domain-containing protein [Actinomycetota bacterium]|nr:Hpt domain-containing protein [Actinomycetota bacterium]
MEKFFDESAIDRLTALGGDKLVREIMDYFFSQVPQKIDSARAAVHDLKTVERAAHSIKSSAGNLGAIHLQKLAGDIEQMAVQNLGQPVPTLIEEMQDAFDRVSVVLKAKRPA